MSPQVGLFFLLVLNGKCSFVWVSAIVLLLLFLLMMAQGVWFVLRYCRHAVLLCVVSVGSLYMEACIVLLVLVSMVVVGMVSQAPSTVGMPAAHWVLLVLA